MRHLRPAAILLLAMTVLAGVIYPAIVTGLAKLLFPGNAAGSLIVRDGRVVGAELIGQRFQSKGYFWPRPSAAGAGYDGMASGGSNLAPSNRASIARIDADLVDWRKTTKDRVPVDLVTASASGLDPHISPDGARLQVRRVAAARRLPAAEVRQLVEQMVEQRDVRLFGERRVNVLKLNIALDELARRQPPAAPPASGAGPREGRGQGPKAR